MKPSIVAGISAVGEVLAVLNKFPWNNVLLTIGLGAVFALILLFCALNISRNSRILRIASRVALFATGLLFLATLIVFVLVFFCNPPDPAGQLIKRNSIETEVIPTGQTAKLEIPISIANDADALRVIFSAPSDERRVKSLYAIPVAADTFSAVNVVTGSDTNDAILYSAPSAGATVKAQVNLTLQSDSDRSPLHILAEVEYLNRGPLWTVLKWIYVYYQKNR